MTRRDIASHLGVAHETVSRSFTALADWGYIRVLNRDVEVLDPDGLRAFSLITRGLVDPHHERHAERHMERLGHGRSSSAHSSCLDGTAACGVRTAAGPANRTDRWRLGTNQTFSTVSQARAKTLPELVMVWGTSAL